MTNRNQPARNSGPIEHYDVVVIGAGVSGMYALHHLREMGLSVRVYDGGSDIGGTWWYNRYPGARVDGPGSPFYCYTFSEELMQEWDWKETQSEQSAVLEYLEHVADRFDLRRDKSLVDLDGQIHPVAFAEHVAGNIEAIDIRHRLIDLEPRDLAVALRRPQFPKHLHPTPRVHRPAPLGLSRFPTPEFH